MADGARLTPAEYLDRLFEVIREEARENADFAARLVRATGGEVVFSDADRPVLLNPLEIAARGGAEGVLDACAGLDAAQLRRVLKDHNLATAVDVRARTRADLLEMLARRAVERVRSRSSLQPGVGTDRQG